MDVATDGSADAVLRERPAGRLPGPAPRPRPAPHGARHRRPRLVRVTSGATAPLRSMVPAAPRCGGVDRDLRVYPVGCRPPRRREEARTSIDAARRPSNVREERRRLPITPTKSGRGRWRQPRQLVGPTTRSPRRCAPSGSAQPRPAAPRRSSARSPDPWRSWSGPAGPHARSGCPSAGARSPDPGHASRAPARRTPSRSSAARSRGQLARQVVAVMFGYPMIDR